ncbi:MULTISPECIES: NIPSNAP family protein [Thalassobaculum]|uniref:NIPSNAP protein n=1 Tax=Thalassobaculum litoreum DSM 18839 TaxID=1123362 RepID=A0A8G2BEH1_9PROT|nr:MULTISPECIES: NIPSNAP family protein [Thalassobaculum]SDF17604.1 NIPSNAP protein [Thalassobaculum litoreum DSM 18839]
MDLYELRTYKIVVGKLQEVLKLYETEGWPALDPHKDKLVGYFVGDVGGMNELIHVWKYTDDADRRAHWAAVYANEKFMAFAAKLRPNLISQENKLMVGAPWGPRP